MLAIGAVVFLVSYLVSNGLTFFQDEWELILRDPAWSGDSLFAPLNEHIYVAPVVIYKVLLAIGGMEHRGLFRGVNCLLLVTVVLLVFAYVRDRLGLGVAVLVALVLGLLGPAWEDLLWPAGISFLGAIAGGLAALRSLEKESPRGDLAACGFLVLSLSFSTLGLVFAFGAMIDVALRRRNWPGRLYIFAIPVLLYLIWYAAYGKDAEGAASIDNFFGIPEYVWASASSGIASLLGLTGVADDSLGVNAQYGRPILVLALVGAVWLVVKEPGRLTTRLWVAVGSAIAFWCLAGLNEIPGREPGASRYQLISAVFIVLIGAELLRGKRLRGPAFAVVALLAAAAIIANLGALRDGEHFLRDRSDAALAQLKAIDLARDQIDPSVVLQPTPTSPFPQPVELSTYLGAVDRWGSPVDSVDSPAELPEPARQNVDAYLAAALGLTVADAGGSADGETRCADVAIDPATGIAIAELPAGGARFELAGGAGDVALRRWSEAGYPVDLGPAGESFALEIPADDSDQPWTAQVQAGPGASGLRICPLSREE